MTGWAVEVEVVLLSLGADGALACRLVRAPLESGACPDDAALLLAGLTDAPSGTVSHSTSWRTDPSSGLVLTYAALPDPAPAGAALLSAPSVVCSTDPLRPSPRGLHAHHVAAHAARHLAYLAVTDPTVRRAAAEHPDLWAKVLLTATAPVAAHEQAHALARHRATSGPLQGRDAVVADCGR